MPFLTVDAIISNQAFSYERRKMFPGFSYKRQKIRFRIQLESPCGIVVKIYEKEY